MKRTTRNFLIATSILILLSAGFWTFISFQHQEPYPTVEQQRASLKNKKKVPPVRLLDSTQIVDDLKYFSSDSCEGRAPGSAGHEKAVERILLRMRQAGLDSFNSSLIQNFYIPKSRFDSIAGKNVIGWLKGTLYPDQYIVISAHYDHLGKRGKYIYYGASDNATGASCILAMAKYFKEHSYPYSLIFAEFDSEEMNLLGSLHFVNKPPVALNKIKLNFNIDMIARNDSNEIFACGIRQYPELKYLVTETEEKTNAKLLMGHDSGVNPDQNWLYSSDHGSFYTKKIPFIYLGVEDHPDYHKPTDTWDRINLSEYIENCNLMLLIAQAVKK